MESAGLKIGFWASLIQSFIGYIYLGMYIAFMIIFSSKPWTNIQDFALQFHGSYMIMLTIIQVLAFLQAFLFFIIAAVISYNVSERRRIIAKIGVYCAVIFLALSSIHYYIQWTTIKQGIDRSVLDGLGQFAQFNFDSPISVINILGWTFFFGIANIAFGFCFKGTSKEKWLKYGFLINGICCVFTSILFAFGVKSVMFIWTAVLSLTWYVYPLLTSSFKNGKLNTI